MYLSKSLQLHKNLNKRIQAATMNGSRGLNIARNRTGRMLDIGKHHDCLSVPLHFIQNKQHNAKEYNKSKNDKLGNDYLNEVRVVLNKAAINQGQDINVSDKANLNKVKSQIISQRSAKFGDDLKEIKVGKRIMNSNATQMLKTTMQKHTHTVEKQNEIYIIKKDKRRAMDSTKGVHTPESRGWTPYARQIEKKF